MKRIIPFLLHKKRTDPIVGSLRYCLFDYCPVFSVGGTVVSTSGLVCSPSIS
jgi:hypothetical protein